MWKWRAVVTCGLLLMVESSLAPAQPADPAHKRASLNWIRESGAEGCPTVKELSQRVDARLGDEAFVAPSNADIMLDATIAPSADQSGWRLRIHMADAEGTELGTRDFTVAKTDCREAVDAVALALALMVGPDALAGDDAESASALKSTCTLRPA